MPAKPNQAPSDKRARAAMFGVLSCFFLSGFAGLLYQTAWLRSLSAGFGTSELAVAAVLAAYMGGLAAGSALAARFVGRVKRPVLLYGVLEAGIAASALCVPFLIRGAGFLYATAMGSRPEPPDAATLGQPLFYLLVAFAVLAIPTALMGATLPLLTRHAVRTDRQVGSRVALLYGINTVGAVAGTLAAAFGLLPRFGLQGTVWIGASVNLLVFVLAWMIARSEASDSRSTDSRSETRISRSSFREGGWVLPVMTFSGLVSFGYEVLWTRMLSHVLGGSIYAFATMLAAFLTGIALGSGLASLAAPSRERAVIGFAWVQVGIGALAALVYAAIGDLIPKDRELVSLAGFAFSVMLPATILIGAGFPLAVRIAARDSREAPEATARVYAWNTGGAIAGAIIAGFWLIPAVGFAGSIKLAVLSNLVLALIALTVALAVPRVSPLRTPASVAGVAVIGLVLIGYNPARPQAVLYSTGFHKATSANTKELGFAVGRSATVLLLETNGLFTIRTNGLPEASVLPREAAPIKYTELQMVPLAVAARPEADSLLVIGFGGGVSLELVPPSIVDIDVVELEPEVIEANRLLSPLRKRDPLADKRVHVVLNDARNALRLTSKAYDLIVSQPSHPWTAGASHLYSREFLQLAKQHLRPGGVFLQWIDANFIDEPLLKVLVRTLQSEFKELRLYHPDATTLLFLASDESLEVERGNPGPFPGTGLQSTEDFVVALAADSAGLARFSQGAPISTDDFNQMATESRSLGGGLNATALRKLLLPLDPLLDAASPLPEGLDYAYVGERLYYENKPERAEALAARLQDPATVYYLNYIAASYRGRGNRSAAQEWLRKAHGADPRNQTILYSMLRDQRGSVSAERQNELTGPRAAVVRGWRLREQGDLRALASLDSDLDCPVREVAYPQAVELRVEWRLRHSPVRTDLVNEALEILDEALIHYPSPSFQRARTRALSLLEHLD